MKKEELKAIIKGKSSRDKTTNSNKLFSICSHIMDNMIIDSAISYIPLMFIEAVHLIYLPLFAVPNKSPSLETFTYGITMTNYPRIFIESTSYNSLAGFMILWSIHIFFCVMLCTSILLMIFLNKKAAERYPKLIKYLSQFVGISIILIHTMLLLPLVEITIFPVMCASEGSIKNNEIIDLSVHFACGSLKQVIMSCVGMFFLMLVIVVFFISMSTLHEDYYFSPLPWAGESKEHFFLHGLVKLATYLYIALDVDLENIRYPLLIIAVSNGYLLYKGVTTLRFMCKKAILLSYNILASVLFCLHFYSSIHELYASSSTLATILGILALGITGGIAIYVRGITKKSNILFTVRSQIKLIKNVEEYVRCLTDLTVGGKESALWEIVLRHLLSVHPSECINENCVCKKLIPEIEIKEGNMQNAPLPGSIEERKQTEIMNNIHSTEFMETVIESEVQKWQQSRTIMLQLSYFELIVMKNYFKAYYWVINSSGSRNKTDEVFSQYRMRHILAQHIMMKEAKVSSAEQMKCVVKFQKSCSALQVLLLHITKTIISFWKLFESSRLNVNELFTIAQKISCMLQTVADLFKKCTDLSPNYPFIYNDYGNFMKLVLNNEVEGGDLIEKGKEIFRQLQESRGKYHEGISKFPSTAVLIISGSLNSLGTILYANQHVKEQLGFSISDLESRNISRIMPASIGERHDEFMLKHLQTGSSYMLGEERLAFIQTKDGLVEPVCLMVKTLPCLYKGMRYIGFVRKDLQRIRNAYIKIPSQYKDRQICFILTDSDNRIIGISKHTCNLFGLTPQYIMRKKGLSSLPFGVGKLAPELDNPANEKQLITGMVVNFDTSAILDFLDYDYLKSSEEAAIFHSAKEKKMVYITMQKMSFKGILNLKVFALVNVSMWHSAKMRLGSIMSKKGKNIDSPKENACDIASQSRTKCLEDASRSDSISGNTFDNLIKKRSYIISAMQGDIKQGSQDDKTATTTRNLRWFIVAFVLVTIGALVCDYTLNLIYVNDIKNLYGVIDFGHRRLIYFNVMIYKIMEHLNAINYYPTGSYQLASEMDYDLTLFLESESNFEKALLSSSISKDSRELIYTSVNVRNIQEDFSIYYEQRTLNVLLYEIASRGIEICKKNQSELKSKNYITSFVNLPNEKLSLTEREMFFFFANALNSPHDLLLQSASKVRDKVENEMNNQFRILLILHLMIYGIVIIFALLFFPIMFTVQKNKRQLLTSFAELSESEVVKLVDRCKNYLNAFATDNSKDVTNLKEEDKKIVNEVFSRKDDSSTDLVALSRFVEQGQEEVKGDLHQDTADDIMRKEKEDTTNLISNQERTKYEGEKVKERKKGIKNVAVSLGYVSIVICVIFIVILAYFSKIFYSLFYNYSEISNSIDAILFIYKRFVYGVSAMVYYRAFMKSLNKYSYKKEEPELYEHFYNLVSTTEEHIKKLKTYPTSILKPIADMLVKYDSPKFCDEVKSILKPSSNAYCSTIVYGLLKEGLSACISFALTKSRDQYILVLANPYPDSIKAKEIADSNYKAQMMMYSTINFPVYEDLETQASNIIANFLITLKVLITIDYIVMFVLILISLIVLLRYFVKTIEEEIATERGILMILPAEIVNKMHIK